jgi:hypothetical protein
MNITQFITEYMPDYLGINRAYGKAAELIYLAEKKGDPSFADDKFDDIRNRAALGIPCCLDIDSVKKENMLDFYEYCLCIHRQRYHSSDYKERIEILIKNPEVQRMAALIDPGPEGFWN